MTFRWRSWRSCWLSEPPQLELSIVTLDDGELVFGMVVRADQETPEGTVDITGFASWRRYLETVNASDAGEP